MVSDEWTTMPLDEAVQINPRVLLERGEVYPFVDMKAVDPASRSVGPSEMRMFKGGGSRFMNGDTLMARITPCLENGKIARFAAPDNQPMGHGSTEFIVIRGKPDVSDNDFVYYLTRWDGVRQYAISQMTGSSGRQRVPTNALTHLEVDLPPLPEQRAIACILGALDDKIELNRRMNETLEAMARAIFKSWFVDFDPVRAKAAGQQPPGLAPHIADLFPDSFEDSELGEIPKGWRVRKLGEVCEFAYGKALKADQRKPGSVPVMGSNGQVGVHDQALVKGPGIIVGRKGNPGIVKWVNTDFFPIDTTFYVVPSGPEYPLTFLCYALEHLDLARFGADSAVPGLNRQIAYGTQLVIPDSKVLESFGRLATSIRDRQHATETESRTLAALRDTLLPRLISGELRVLDAERIVGRCV